MAKFQRWLVVSGSHYQNGKSYKKGARFVTDADLSKFNIPHAPPKYKLLGDATEAEIIQFQADSGFSGTPEPKHVEDPIPVPTSQPEPEVTEESEDTELEGEEVPEDSLEALTVAELKSLAKDESIDISGIHTKADIIARIREARAE